jgi:hypothetical protein
MTKARILPTSSSTLKIGIFAFFRHVKYINVIMIVLFMMANPIPIARTTDSIIDATTTLCITFNRMYGSSSIYRWYTYIYITFTMGQRMHRCCVLYSIGMDSRIVKF